MRKLWVMAMLTAACTSSKADDAHAIVDCNGWPSNGNATVQECEQACANYADVVVRVECSAHYADGTAAQCGDQGTGAGITWMGEKGCCTAELGEVLAKFATCDDQ